MSEERTSMEVELAELIYSALGHGGYMCASSHWELAEDAAKVVIAAGWSKS